MKRVVVAFVTLLALLGCSRTHSSESSISSLISTKDDNSLSDSRSHSYTYRNNGIPINGITTEYFANDYLDCRIFRSSSPLTDEQNVLKRFKSVSEVNDYVNQLKEAKDQYYGTLYYSVIINYLETLSEETFISKDLVISQGITNYSMGITDYLTNVELKDEKIYFVAITRTSEFEHIFVSEMPVFDILMLMSLYGVDFDHEFDKVRSHSIEEYDYEIGDYK